MTQHPFARSACRQHGFSVLELLSVVAITGIVVAIGLVRAQGAMRSYRLQESAAAVSTKLLDARINALKRNRPAWVSIDPVTRTLQVQMADAAGNPVNIGPLVRLSQGVVFAGTVPAQVVFDALGRLATSQSIAMQDDTGEARTLTVALTGTVRTSPGLPQVTSPDGGGTTTGGGTTGGGGTTTGGGTTSGGTTYGETGGSTTPVDPITVLEVQ
jgi:prepilin-type N-terminal cleavage/methylation domain-containing protein